MLLGGRIAEELVFGDVSTGAQDDLQRASDMARRMITQFGMDEALGLATYESPPNPLFSSSGLPQRERKEYSERTAQMIDAQVRKTLAEAGLRVRATLAGQRARLDAGAAAAGTRGSRPQRSRPPAERQGAAAAARAAAGGQYTRRAAPRPDQDLQQP